MTPTDYAIKEEFARIDGDEEKARLYETKKKQAIKEDKSRFYRVLKNLYSGLV